jgi:hypothetical protein
VFSLAIDNQMVGLFVPSLWPYPPPPPFGPWGGGRTHSLTIEGAGGSNSDDSRESLALCILCA